MELTVLSMKDVDRMKELFRDVFTNAPWNDDWSDEGQLDAYLKDLAGQERSLTLGYFDEGRLIALSIGNIRHWYTGTEYYIDELCVARDRQGQGIGTAFLQDVERYLVDHGITQIFLQTEADMPAYPFYIKRGFLEQRGHVSLAKRSLHKE